MKKALLVLLSFIVIEAVVGGVFAGILMIAAHVDGHAFNPASLQTGNMMAVILLVSNLLIILAVWLLLRRRVGQGEAHRSQRHAGLFLAVCAVAMVPLMVVVNGLSELLSLSNIMAEQFDMMKNNPLAILAIVLVGPVAEEVCFRWGVEGSLLDDPRFRRYAIVISALVFGAIHVNPVQSVGAFFIGLYLGWLYARTRSLWPSIVCHVLNNLLGVIQMNLTAPDATMKDLLGGSTPFVVVMIVSALFFFLLFWLLRRMLAST